MRKVNYDIVSSILLIVISGIAIWETRGLSKMSYIFPRTIGILLLILSVMYVIASSIKPHNKKLFEDIDKRKVFVMGLGMIGYFIIISLLGFLIASILYIWLFTWYLQKEDRERTNKSKILRSGLSSIAISGLFFVLFRYVFLVPLPAGLLG